MEKVVGSNPTGTTLDTWQRGLSRHIGNVEAAAAARGFESYRIRFYWGQQWAAENLCTVLV